MAREPDHVPHDTALEFMLAAERAACITACFRLAFRPSAGLNVRLMKDLNLLLRLERQVIEGKVCYPGGLRSIRTGLALP
jgi:hypothetical protein